MSTSPFFAGAMSWGSKNLRDVKNQLLACMALNFIILMPIVLHVPLYLDDYSRATFGVFGWARDARPLADVLFFGLNLGTPLVAVSPLYQLISLVILSITCVVAARTYRVTSPWIGAIATLPLIGQPYYLANLSFGFDCLSMSLAQCFAITGSAVLLLSKTRASYAIALMLLLATLLMYQSSASSFLAFGLMFVLAAAIGLVADPGPSRIPDKLLKLFSCYTIALGVFALFVGFVWKSPSPYAERASRLIDLDSEIVFAIARNRSAISKHI